MSELRHASGDLDLRALTTARVSLGRTGSSMVTSDVLDFALAHAQARDAVHATLSLPTLLEALHARGLQPVMVHSAAPDRATYLRRPDLGRTLGQESRERLAAIGVGGEPEGSRLSIVLADGLSALAVDRHAVAILDELLQRLSSRFTLTPVIVAEQARVALGDEIGQALRANLTIMLIGERPGLSAPDSLGAYLTWNPKPSCTDAQRNCISNIREQGLDYKTAAARIAWLCGEAQRLRLSGTAIKEASGQLKPGSP